MVVGLPFCFVHKVVSKRKFAMYGCGETYMYCASVAAVSKFMLHDRIVKGNAEQKCVT